MRNKIADLEETTVKDSAVFLPKSEELTGSMKRGCTFADKVHGFVEICLKIGSALQKS